MTEEHLLNAADLCTPTRWIVLTGAPAAGKSTIIQELKRHGVRAIDELARDEIGKQPAVRSRDAELAFQSTVIDRIRSLETTLPANEFIVFDRGLPDGIAFLRYSRLESDWVKPLCYPRRYACVILVEQVPERLVNWDELRKDREFDHDRLEELIQEAYHEVGYQPVRLPFMPIADRVRFVLQAGRAKHV